MLLVPLYHKQLCSSCKSPNSFVRVDQAQSCTRKTSTGGRHSARPRKTFNEIKYSY